MDMIFTVAAILQSIAVSLGVGCSTLAIINYFVALADGRIDENERKMMGVVYTVLRIAMVLIIATTAVIAFLYMIAGTPYFMGYTLGYWTLILMLFLNAYLMSKHIMPPSIGPGLQATTWYTLGILTALVPIGYTAFSYFEFFIGYLAAIALGVTIVNATMAVLKKQREGRVIQ